VSAAESVRGPSRPWRSKPLAVGLHRLIQYVALLIVLALLWEAVIWAFRIPSYLLPTPSAVLTALADHAGAVRRAALYTIGCTIAGMALSVAVALSFAIAFIASALLGRALMPLMIAVRAVPMIAITPLIVIIFGRGPGNSIGVVALLTFFQIMLAARKGFTAPSPNMLEMMHTYGASFWQIQMKVRMPFAVPYIFTGLRIASGSAILCAMFAEWLSGVGGLGHLILDSYAEQQFALMWAAVLTSMIASYLFLTFTIVAERFVMERSR
jgi:NitT/TauT family transport system permease protein